MISLAEPDQDHRKAFKLKISPMIAVMIAAPVSATTRYGEGWADNDHGGWPGLARQGWLHQGGAEQCDGDGEREAEGGQGQTGPAESQPHTLSGCSAGSAASFGCGAECQGLRVASARATSAS